MIITRNKVIRNCYVFSRCLLRNEMFT